MAASPSSSGAASIGRIAFVSLGCPKNLIDSEQMLAALVGSGFALVSDHDEADAVVINTCGFLEAAKEESLEVIHEAIERKRRGRIKRVVVAGCLVQRHRAKLLDWAPGIDAMIGVFDRDHIIDAVGGAPGSGPSGAPGSGASGAAADASRRVHAAGSTGSPEPIPRYWIAANALQAARERGVNTATLTVRGDDGRGLGYFEDDSNRFRLTPRHWTYLRISEGCNQKCAFCTIPSIRGKMRSKPPEIIVKEARKLLMEGAFELNLIGEDTTSYGCDIGYDGPGEGIAGLLRALDNLAGEFGSPAGGGAWLRLMYAYPSNFTDKMINAIAGLPNVVKYIDMPLQHVSDRMLAAMRRNVTGAQQEQLLGRLRECIPGLAVRTTLITGFPGETEDDHRELLRFIEDFQFDMLGVFQYSQEDHTPAARMDDDPALHVPAEVKARREAELMLTQQRIAFENARYVAEQRCQFDVLIDGPVDPDIEGEDGRRRRTGDGEHAPKRPASPPPVSPPGDKESGPLYAGRCYHQAPQVDSVTYVRSTEPLSPGELVRCTIIDAEGYDFIARPTDQVERRVALPVLG